NAAAVAAPNDVLQGNLSGAGGPFNASGSLAGIAAQGSDDSSLSVALDTAHAGSFSGSAGAAFNSHNAEMADLLLSGSSIALQAQVVNFAELALGKAGGDGALASAVNGYTLDFGTIVRGSADRAAELDIFNVATGPADLLNGSFSFAGASGFVLSGLDPFAGIAAGHGLGGFGVVLDSAATGAFSQTITVSSFGTNASGYRGPAFDTTLVLRGSVVDVAAIPEPESYAMMLAGLVAICIARRRQLRRPD
ncbi:MAG: PEP-CTERM sorting domain-containing protein, partial [Caldimonas sp.]